MKNKNHESIKYKILDMVKEYADLKYASNKFEPGVTQIPSSGKVIGANEIINMVDASLDGWLTAGRYNQKFELGLKNFLGVRHVLTVNSGSSANLVAFSTLTSHKLGDKAIKPGDEVIGVAAGFPTTINPIIQFGAIPVFVDIDIDTHNIDASKIEKAISPKTKAIMLAHSLGNPFNLDKVTAICKKYDLWLIEDCCDALGATYDGKMVGTFGDISTLSFYPAHHITMGEGGAVFTNSAKLNRIAKSFRDWGKDCFCEPGVDNTCNRRFGWTKKQLGGNLPDGYDHKYIFSHTGYNLKISDMQAACGYAQLSKLKAFIDKRRLNFNYLFERLKSCSNFIQLPVTTPKASPSWFGFPIYIKPDTGFKRKDLLLYLNEKNIGTRLLFAGNVTKQPYMQNHKYKVSENLENTDLVMKQTFWIGVFPGLNDEHLHYAASNIENFFGIK